MKTKKSIFEKRSKALFIWTILIAIPFLVGTYSLVYVASTTTEENAFGTGWIFIFLTPPTAVFLIQTIVNIICFIKRKTLGILISLVSYYLFIIHAIIAISNALISTIAIITGSIGIIGYINQRKINKNILNN